MEQPVEPIREEIKTMKAGLLKWQELQHPIEDPEAFAYIRGYVLGLTRAIQLLEDSREWEWDDLSDFYAMWVRDRKVRAEKEI